MFLIFDLLPGATYQGPFYSTLIFRKHQEQISYKKLAGILALPIPLMLVFIFTLLKQNTCLSYDNILCFSLFFAAYLISLYCLARFVRTELAKAEDEEKKYQYLTDKELHDGKMNVYQRIIEDKYFDYARYIKVHEQRLRDLGASDDEKKPLGFEEIEGLRKYCITKSSGRGIWCCKR